MPFERNRRWLLTRGLALVAGFLFGRRAGATVYYARNEAMALAFPDMERIEEKRFFLTGAQRTAIEEHAHSKLESDLLTVHVGHQHGAIQRYAIFDTHTVRTVQETLLIVLAADGSVAGTHLLAFYEPPEYRPPDRWLEQFRSKRMSDDLAIGKGIAGITGATLTANAVSASVRRALAIYTTLLKTE